MSTFNRFCAKVRRGFIKMGDKVEELGDNAASSVRAKGLEIRIDEQYENLGRIVYRDLHTEENLEEEKLAVIAAIDALFDELEQIKANKAAKKETAQKEEATEACDPACECTEEAPAAQACEEAACDCAEQAADAE